LLLDPLYPGKRPSVEAAARARELAAESQTSEDSEDALKLLSEAVLLSPPDASLYLARTEAHSRQRQLVEALDDAELCVSLDASCVDGWLAKGQAEHSLGRAADAALSFQAGLNVEPEHAELLAHLESVRAEPTPNLLRQLRDFVFAVRLGMENLFRTVEDPEKTTDAWVESNSELLDAQIGLLSQTLRVNTAVLFESPLLCDAYEQIVFVCSQLVSGAPAAFSKHLRNAPDVVEGLSLALRVGWHVHHSVPKLAANALATLSICPNADDALRRQAVRHLLAGMLRWLLDARPEPDNEGEEVCGCSCSVPWKAAACFIERLFEPGRPQPWVREECESWPDAAQLCQWLTLSVRDYHATPLGLVGLLQLPGVAAACMRSEAIVDFFIPAPIFEDEDLDRISSATSSPAIGPAPTPTGFFSGRSQLVASSSASSSSGASLRQHSELPATAESSPGGGGSMSSAAPVPSSHEMSTSGAPAEEEELTLPSAQRLGEWLIASVGYLLLFIEGDILFTVCACRALQTMATVEPDSLTRLLSGLWLGVPLLNKLSLFACSHTAALDLLHCLLRGPHPGVRVAARSLAHALSRPLPGGLESSASGFVPTTTATVSTAASSQPLLEEHHEASASATASFAAASTPDTLVAVAAAAVAAVGVPTLEDFAEEDMVPSWAEFYQELLNELACPPDGKGEPPELVTLLNFEDKARLLAECAKVHVLPTEEKSETDGIRGEDADVRAIGYVDDDNDMIEEVVLSDSDTDLVLRVPEEVPDAKGHGADPTKDGDGVQDIRSPHAAVSSSASLDFTAVPAAWNRYTESQGHSRDNAIAWRGLSANGRCIPLLLFHSMEEDADIGSEEYISDARKHGYILLMSRSSIRHSSRVQNWAQAVLAAETAGAIAVIVFNNLDGLEPFRMGLFGEPSPAIPAFMVSGVDGAALTVVASKGCRVTISRSLMTEATSSIHLDDSSVPLPPPWPLTGGRLPADVAQAWSLLEAMSSHEPWVQAELGSLLDRMNVPEKRVWLTRQLVRHHRSQQAPDGGLEEPPLAFAEGDRSLSSSGQIGEVRRQMCEATGLGAEDICGEFEVRFKDEGGVGSAVVREWLDIVAREAFLHPERRLLRTYDRRQTFLPDPAATFCNPHWQMDYEALGRLLGLALWQSCTLDLPLHPHVCAMLCEFEQGEDSSHDRERRLQCLADIDDDLYRLKVRWLLDNPVEDLGFDMPFCDPIGRDDSREASTGEVTDEQQTLPAVVVLRDRLPGNVRTWPGNAPHNVGAAEIDLTTIDGEEATLDAMPTVTDENKVAFVEALVDWRLRKGLEPQVAAMAKGLRTVVPDSVLKELRSLLTPAEVSQLLSGMGEIDADDWETHTAYALGLSRESDIVKWFWRLVRDWSESETEKGRLPQLLQFVTGSARVPVGGFAELVGFNGSKHPFTLSRGSHLTTQSLPMAHACICTLDLPMYEDEETCRAKLTQMLTLGRAHFDEAAGHAED
jgi:tetratricopeptide (TPR) repeat protein